MTQSLPPLTPEQQAAFEKLNGFSEAKTFLLHGVTGSGKTRVYIESIRKLLTQNERAQVLILVPEIALTPQMTQIFEEVFPDQLAVVHSGLSDTKRWEEWNRVREGAAKILIGARSAIFAPFQKLQLIIVDEEHDQSYKQSTGLSYHARDLAVVRSKMEGISCILGSATPSLESYANARQGKYEYLNLPSRAMSVELPTMELLPIEKKVWKERLSHKQTYEETNCFLSPAIQEALESNAQEGHQAIVLVNRRGYAYYLFDHEKGCPIECPDCSISLSVHRNKTLLICHYCGYQRTVQELLKEHPHAEFSTVGTGTQKAEMILKERMPHLRVGRLDSDVLSSRERLFEVLSAFRNRELDILVGTQILAKGHDFPHVGLTVICEFDQLLDLPDFRAGERAFQLILQAAGRAGRSGRQGKVLIQSTRAGNPLLSYAMKHDYLGFVDSELQLRKSYGYPPFRRLIRLEFTSESVEAVEALSQQCRDLQEFYFERERALFTDVRIIGPLTPPIERINKRYRRSLLISSGTLERAHAVAYKFLSHLPLRKGDARIQVDVDPQSLI